MKFQRKSFLLVAVGVAFSLVAAYGVSAKMMRQQKDTPGKLPDIIIDGAKQPDAVPDWVAYDVLVHTIAAMPTAKSGDKQAADNLAKEVGLDGVKTPALQRSAYAVVHEIASLDRQVAEIKDQHWPKPSKDVLDQLSDLQKQKEAILAKFASELSVSLGIDGAQSVSNHIRNNIKPKIKVFREVPIESYQHH